MSMLYNIFVIICMMDFYGLTVSTVMILSYCVSQINFVKEQFKGTEKEWVLLVCIGASSGVGRLTFGKIGDLIPGLRKVYMQVRELLKL